jgi:hypothetical protein
VKALLSATIAKLFALVLVALLLSSCMDMFSPTGGSYAVGRYTDPQAITFTASPSATGVTLLGTPNTAKSPVRIRSAYFITKARVGQEAKNGPLKEIERLPNGTILLRLTWDEVRRYDGIGLMGVYLEPAKVIDGARSVEANGKFEFTPLRESAP